MPSIIQINTTEKGDHYENRVYAILQKLLADEALFVPGKHSKIFRKKGYYSKDREGEIILIECRNCNTSVTENDVEEFAGKVSVSTAIYGKGL